MLLLHGIGQPHAAQDFRREIGNAGENHAARLRQRVAHAQNAVIGNADNVARPGLVHRLALGGEEQDGIVHPDGFAGAGLFQLHVAAKTSRRQTQKRHPVAVIGIHIGLDLEDKAADFVIGGLHRAPDRRLVARRRRMRGQSAQQLGDAEILQRRTEIDRREMAFAIGGQIEGWQALARQR